MPRKVCSILKCSEKSAFNSKMPRNMSSNPTMTLVTQTLAQYEWNRMSACLDSQVRAGEYKHADNSHKLTDGLQLIVYGTF